MRLVSGSLILVFLATSGAAFADQTILLRKRPLKLEEGIVAVREAGEVELDSHKFGHTLELQLMRVVREIGPGSRPTEEPSGVIEIAANVDDDTWRKLRERLDAHLESLDPSAFRDEWAGMQVDQNRTDVWTDLLADVPEYIVFICFEPSTGEPLIHKFYAKLEDGGRNSGRSSLNPEGSRQACAALQRMFYGEPERTLSTFPATIDERVQRLTAVSVDESYIGETAELPQDASFAIEEKDGEGALRRTWSGTKPRPANDDAWSSDETEQALFSTVERRIEQGEGEAELWISSTVADTEIHPATLKDSRFLGIRLRHSASIVHGGVMPLADEDVGDRGADLLIAVLPQQRISAAKQDAFLRSVAERADRSERDVSATTLRDAAVDSLAALEMKRPFAIVCGKDEVGSWFASYLIDEASANVQNPDDVCDTIARRIGG